MKKLLLLFTCLSLCGACFAGVVYYANGGNTNQAKVQTLEGKTKSAGAKAGQAAKSNAQNAANATKNKAAKARQTANKNAKSAASRPVTRPRSGVHR